MARPPSGANNNSDEKIGPEMIRTPDINEIDFQTMIKQMNSQLWEQKKAVSKVSKLCLGALTSVEQLESRVNKEGIQGNLLRGLVGCSSICCLNLLDVTGHFFSLFQLENLDHFVSFVKFELK